MFEDLVHIVGRAEARCFRTDAAAAVGKALAGQNAVFVGVLDALILSEQIADLLAAHAEVASGNVHIGADVAVQLRHERLAEPHDLRVASAAGVKVAAALAAADGEAGQAVFERLLKAQELHDRQVHRRMEAQTALVRPDRAVKLHAVAAVDLRLARVVRPHHAKLDHAFRLHHALQQRLRLVFRVLFHHRRQRAQHLFHRLQKLFLVPVLLPDLFQYPFDVCVHVLFVPPVTCKSINEIGGCVPPYDVFPCSSYPRRIAVSTR